MAQAFTWDDDWTIAGLAPDAVTSFLRPTGVRWATVQMAATAFSSLPVQAEQLMWSKARRYRPEGFWLFTRASQ